VIVQTKETIELLFALQAIARQPITLNVWEAVKYFLRHAVGGWYSAAWFLSLGIRVRDSSRGRLGGILRSCQSRLQTKTSSANYRVPANALTATQVFYMSLAGKGTN